MKVFTEEFQKTVLVWPAMICLHVYRLQRELQAKRQELQQKLVEDASKLAAVIAETKELKSFVEEHISGLVKGIEVHVTGDVNNTLLK